jgi:antitoxin YefM
MPPVSTSDLRQNLARYLDEVSDTRAPLVVTRQGGSSVVMLAEEEYESLVETVHLLRSPANARRLFESLRQAESGDFVEPTLAETPGRGEA